MTDTTGGAIGALGVLSASAAALARASNLDTALSVIVEAGAAAAGASSAVVFAQEPERDDLELLLTLGMPEGSAAAFAAEVAGDPDHPVRLAALDRTGSLGRVARRPDGREMTSVDLPLVVASAGGIEDCVGVLTFGWDGLHEVGTDEETLLVGIADLVAAGLAMFRTSSMVAERAEWYERVAHTDPLTGLANDRTVQRVLELEVARAQRQGSEVSVALFDVDAFRDLNEAAGSRAGDLVLRQVASILAGNVRLVDTIGRTGADEFVLVAPGSAGVTVARRVMTGVATLEPVEGHEVTVSAGVARFPQDGTDAASLLAAARAALAGSGDRSSIVEATAE